MKANYVTLSESAIRRKIEEVYQKKKDQVYENVMKDVLPQFMAVCLCELSREFGFGEKRLRRFLDGIIAEFEVMNAGVLENKYSPLDCLKYLKEKYEIDVDKEFGNESN